MTLSDKERDAHRMYIELDEKKNLFTLMHCYIEFEKYPKWQTRPLPQKKQKKTSDASPSTTSYPKWQTRPLPQKKQKKTSDASPSTTSNDEDFGVCTDALEEELRPPGTKHNKNERLRKGKTSESNDSGCKLSLESVWAQKIEKDDIKEATKIARYARAFELQEKQIKLQEREGAQKQFELDEKIMLMDTSHMSDAQKQFYKNKQDEIVARCQNTSG